MHTERGELPQISCALVVLILLATSPLNSLNLHKKNLVGTRNETIIVPDDFPTIQEAINHASFNCTIFVKNGTYYERIVVNQTVSLIGESRSATIIDGGGSDVVVKITDVNVTVRQFTIRNSGYGSIDAGVLIVSNHSRILNNEITDNAWGVVISGRSYAVISGNIIAGEEHSMGDTWGGGVFLQYSHNNTITGNEILVAEDNGIYLWETCCFNKIVGNSFSNQFLSGINLGCSNNEIHHNNFMETSSQIHLNGGVNTWNDDYPFGGNYWNDYSGSDIFRGIYQNETGRDGFGDSPYIINGDNVDTYPLMQPFGSIRNLDTDLCYTRIQSAINANETRAGHTISVSAGTYYENFVLDKHVSLVGANKQTTFIDGRHIANVVTIMADNARLHGFTIKNSGGDHCGIYTNSIINTISEVVVTNSFNGIFIEDADTIIVTDSTVTNNIYGITVHGSNNISILSSKMSSNTGYGIKLASAAHCDIGANNLSYNSHGVYLDDYSTNITVHENTVSNNFYGAYLDDYSTNITVHENTVSNNFYGICIYNSNSNVVFRNNILNNTHQAYSHSSVNKWDHKGIGNYWSNYNGTDQNADGIGDIPYSIEQDGSTDYYPLINPIYSIRNIDTDLLYLTIQSAIDADETLAGHTIDISPGKYYGYLVINKSIALRGETSASTIIGINDTENVITITANNVIFKRLIIATNATSPQNIGIHIHLSNYTVIRDCIITSNRDGILIDRSHHAEVVYNAVINNSDEGAGIILQESENTTIQNNNFTDSNIGIALNQSRNSDIIYNLIARSRSDGVQLSGPNTNNNFIAYNQVVQNGYNSTLGSDGISLYLADNNTICNNTIILNTRSGLLLAGSKGNCITRNMIHGNSLNGITLIQHDAENSTQNLIAENSISENDCGIQIETGYQNTIFHNNFLNNSEQVNLESLLDQNIWDNGCEGNYWSNYNGSDSNYDGIGDTPYAINGNNQDRYPLVNPYWNVADFNHDLKVDIYDIVLLCGAYLSTPSDLNWNCHCDITEPYGVIDIFDVVLMCGCYGETYGC